MGLLQAFQSHSSMKYNVTSGVLSYCHMARVIKKDLLLTAQTTQPGLCAF